MVTPSRGFKLFLYDVPLACLCRQAREFSDLLSISTAGVPFFRQPDERRKSTGRPYNIHRATSGVGRRGWGSLALYAWVDDLAALAFASIFRQSSEVIFLSYIVFFDASLSVYSQKPGSKIACLV